MPYAERYGYYKNGRRSYYTRRPAAVDVSDVAQALGSLALSGAASYGGSVAGRAAGKYVGRRAARALGAGKKTTRRVQRVTKTIGSVAGAMAPKLLGMGAYEIGESSGPSDNLRMDVAQSEFRISKTEYIGDVYSGSGTPTAFNLETFAVNPGLDTNNGGIFTWLPQIARAFEEYKFEQLVIEYRPTSGSSTGADTSVGEVIMAGQYRNASDDFVNKAQMLNSMFATSAAPYCKQYFPVELAKISKPFAWHNVRDGDLPASSDLDLADTIKFSLATQGCPTANQNLGSIYVHSTVVFQKPTVDTSDSNLQGAVAFIAGATDIVTEASPFSSSVNNVHLVSGSTFELELVTSTTNIGHIRVPSHFGPPGSLWRMMIVYKGASTAVTNPVVSTHNGFSVYTSVMAANQADGGGSATAFSTWSNNSATSSTSILNIIFQFDGVTDGSQPYIALTFASATIPASATDCWVSLDQLNSSAFNNPLV